MMPLDSFAFLLLMLQISCMNGYVHSSISTRRSFFAFGSRTQHHDNRKKNNNNIISDNEGQQKHSQTIFFSSARRYGPSSSSYSSTDDGNKNKNESSSSSSSSNNKDNIKIKKEEFQNLVDKVLQISQPEHIPRLLVNNIEFILGLQKEDGAQVISSLLEDVKQKTTITDDGKDDTGSNNSDGVINDDDSNISSNDSYYIQTIQTVEMILSFAEDFVMEVRDMDANNKQLLGKIIKSMVSSENDTSIAGGEQGNYKNNADSSSSREEALDRLMKKEKDNFTAGFLRHIEGECDRITNAPKMTPDSTRLLEIMRLIQTRVLEELGQDLGEAALALGQLVGYDKDEELLGVLDAGLLVQGTDFAQKMKNLTLEALDGFKQLPGGGADPDLVHKVNLIDKRLQQVLDESNQFQ